MLRARCSAALARAGYPDLVGGLYEESEGEEMKGHKTATVTSIAPPPVETPPAQAQESVTVEAQVVEAPPAATQATMEDVVIFAKSNFPDDPKRAVKDAWLKAGIPHDTKSSDLSPLQLNELMKALAATAGIDF
jgi:hypothetical protein